MSVKIQIEDCLSLNMPGQAEALVLKTADQFSIKEVYDFLARTNLARGNLKAARGYAKRSTQCSPTSAESWRLRSLPEITSRNAISSDIYLKAALVLDPASASAYATSTTFHRSVGNTTESERFNRYAGLIAPTSNEVLRTRAALQFATGRIHEADLTNKWDW